MNTNQYVHSLANPFDYDYYGKEFSHNQNMVDHRFIKSNGESFSEHRHSQTMNMNSQQFVPFQANSNACGVDGLNLPQDQLKEHRLAHSNILPLDDQRNSHTINMVPEPYTPVESNYSGSDVNGINLTQRQRIQEHNMVRDGMLPSASYSCDSGQAEKKKCSRERNFVCEVCGHSFSEMASLKVHSQTHSGDMSHPCEMCDKKFASREELRSHLVSHSEEKRFKCDLCDKKYVSKQSMQDHRVIIHSGEKPYVCEVCQNAFSVKRHLSRHMLSHSEERPYACDHCDKKFKSKRHLANHKIFHFKEKPLLCDLCSDTFYMPQALRNHQKRVHFGFKPYHCEICSKQFSNKNSFLRHVQGHDQSDSQILDVDPNTAIVEKNPRNIRKIFQDEPHMCVTCREAFADECELEEHKLHHKREKPFACSICPVRFFRSSNLKLHLRIVHSIEPTPEEKKSLKSQHPRKYQKEEGKVACDQCGKKLKRHANLRYHVRRYHSLSDSMKDRPHQCPVCSQRFLEKSHLKTHLRCHGELSNLQIKEMSSEKRASDEEDAQVDDPQEEGSQKSRKRRNGEGKVACDQCGKKLMRPANLRYHVRRYHSLNDSMTDRPHQCPMCSLRFSKLAYLKWHSCFRGELSYL